QEIAAKYPQPYFPVVHGGKVLGIVERRYLLRRHPHGLTDDGDPCYISDLMNRDYGVCRADDVLRTLLEEHTDYSGPIVVEHEGEFVGLVFRENLFDYLFLKAHRRKGT